MAAGAFVAIAAVFEVVAIAQHHGIGGDFAGTIYHPAEAVVHGRTPYGNPHVPGPLAGSVYPPSAFVPLFALGLLPRAVAVAIWLVALTAAAVATLAVLGVRDLRLYGLWLVTPMMLSTLAVGNATVAVVALCALLWRWRDTPVASAAALSGAIAIKLFVLPLLVWLVVQRRYRAAVTTAVAVPVVILAAWAVTGFSALGRYGSILRANRDVFGADGPFLQQLVLQVGGSSRAALAAGVLAAAALLAGAALTRDLTSFSLALAAAIVLSPVAWIGYLALFGIPLAVLWQRLSPAWLLLLVGGYAHWYYAPFRYKSAGLSVFTLALAGAVLAWIVVEDRRRARI